MPVGLGSVAMAHIDLPDGIPGILGPMALGPETAVPLNALAEVLLPRPIPFRGATGR